MFIVREKATRVFPFLVNINQTQLKDSILSMAPEIKAFQKGREVILVFEKDVGQTMITAFEYTNGTCMYLAKATEIALKEMMYTRCVSLVLLMKFP
jgi:hypothetical protein